MINYSSITGDCTVPDFRNANHATDAVTNPETIKPTEKIIEAAPERKVTDLRISGTCLKVSANASKRPMMIKPR